MLELVFDSNAIEDLHWWVKTDSRKALEVFGLIQAVQCDPFFCVGKPGSLDHELSGCCSRRIDQEHRLVYRMTNQNIRIIACRYHY